MSTRAFALLAWSICALSIVLVGLVLTDSFKTSLYPTLYIVWIKGQPEV
jgi:hypothetical protein